jgi:predicted HTH transcriptional regulator
MTTQIELIPATPAEADSQGHCSATPCWAPSAVPLNNDQREVIALLKKQGTLTSEQAVKIFGRRIYCNATDHIGRRLARMVKRGLIVRLKPGVFALPNNAMSHERSELAP